MASTISSDRRETTYHWRSVFPNDVVPINARSYCLVGDSVTHDHDFMEIAVVLSGHGRHRSADGDRPIGRGAAFVLRPGAWHGYHDCRDLVVFNCCFAVELLHRELAWTMDDPPLNALLWSGPLAPDRQGFVSLRLPADPLRACRQHLEAMARTGDDPQHRADRLGRLMLLLGELARCASRSRDDGDDEADGAARRPVHPAVLRGMRLLEQDLARDWTLDDLADALDIDPSYLVRRFKSATGLPPMAYLARCRAERAASLLLRTGEQIGAIGTAVGWDDPNYFARRFRSHFKLSASAYRARFAPRDGS